MRLEKLFRLLLLNFSSPFIPTWIYLDPSYLLGVALLLLSTGFLPTLFTFVLLFADTGLDGLDGHVDVPQVRLGRGPDGLLLLLPCVLVGTDCTLNGLCDVDILQRRNGGSDLVFCLLLLPTKQH